MFWGVINRKERNLTSHGVRTDKSIEYQWVGGKIYRKPLSLPVNIEVSCRFALKHTLGEPLIQDQGAEDWIRSSTTSP